ncbi:MAG: DUF2752 domain-containing protein [Bacteroides sp.]|nr:DUF2752 domain-containing protein [Bacteroides sp.]MCM1413567.1 DUF2752 domain-containing protein [Bacteroides sp.]MCM1471121.1 DUF2752 domain-containing protein [Bacteroides sp.]
MTTPDTRRIILTVTAAIAVVAVIVVYASFDPAAGHFPQCFIKSLTGYDCPGCGSQRAFHALLHGRLADAWHYNAFMICALPALAVITLAELMRDRMPRTHDILTSRRVGIAFIVTTVAWTIFRNI